MNIIRIVVVIFVILGAFILGYFYCALPKREFVYELKKPLHIESNDKTHEYYLPPGTVLFYEDTFPEGFIMYRVYIDVHGYPFRLKKAERKGLKAPLTTFVHD